jgi:hypothetical protein
MHNSMIKRAAALQQDEREVHAVLQNGVARTRSSSRH